MDEQKHFFYLFKHSNRYKFKKPLGKGAYGYVCSAYDTQTKRVIAIKKISNLNNPTIALRTLREIKLLKHFRNTENIINIKTAILPETKNFNEVFFVQECMEADLHYIIYSKQVLSTNHIKYLLYQIICGLEIIHKAGVIHRDLKPSNCLVNSKCQLKICDFGLARENVGEDDHMSNYVQTRWYRAPELLFKNQNYTYTVDMWSVGCIFAEMLLRKPLLKGNNSEDQIMKMIQFFGTPDEKVISQIKDVNMKTKVKMINHPKLKFSNVFPNLCVDGLDLIMNLFDYNALLRIDTQTAKLHDYFDFQIETATNKTKKFNDKPKNENDLFDIKKEIYSEILDFYKIDAIEKSMVVSDDLMQ